MARQDAISCRYQLQTVHLILQNVSVICMNCIFDSVALICLPPGLRISRAIRRIVLTVVLNDLTAFIF